MINNEFVFPNNFRKNLVAGWLFIAITALTLSGIYSILIVLNRTPGFQNIIPFKDFFHTAIVAHVDLSVLVWMLSMSAALFATLGRIKFQAGYSTCLVLASIGMGLIAIAPFTGQVVAIMNNYIPMLQSIFFIIGLALFACSIIIHLILTLATTNLKELSHPLSLAIYFGALITLASVIAFYFSYEQLIASYSEVPNQSFDLEWFYEQLFWGGGHLLQYTYTHMMVIAWLILALACGYTIKLSPRLVHVVFGINLALVVPALVSYGFYPASTDEHRMFFTEHMRYGLAILPTISLILLLVTLLSKPRPKIDTIAKPLLYALLCSILLFCYGGILGYLIRGVNVTIPAHYHGSIVGITLGFMGLCYYLIPALGFQSIQSKAARLQPLIYAAGQALHITGLAISGGYGTLRKTSGAAPTHEAQFWMGIMGLGGLIAIIGGLMFVVIAYKAMMKEAR